jgi:hypothetical protein
MPDDPRAIEQLCDVNPNFAIQLTPESQPVEIRAALPFVMARNEVEQARGSGNVLPPKAPDKPAHLVNRQGLIHSDRNVDANGPPLIRRPSEPIVEDLRPKLAPKLKKSVLFSRLRRPPTEDRTVPK